MAKREAGANAPVIYAAHDPNVLVWLAVPEEPDFYLVPGPGRADNLKAMLPPDSGDPLCVGMVAISGELFGQDGTCFTLIHVPRPRS